MKKIFAFIFVSLVVVPACLAWWLFPENTAPDEQAVDNLSLRKKAYELANQNRLEEADTAFGEYLAKRSSDVQSTYDYAILLAQLGQHEKTAALLEKVHAMNPARETAYFKLGVEYVILKRDADAAKVFEELKSSGNRDIVLAAAEAGSRLSSDTDRAAHYEAEALIYRLAREYKHEEVIAAIGDMEKRWPLSFEMEMQRLYAFGNLQKYAPALERANELAVKYPKATDLMLIRADFLMQLGHKDEAIVLWDQVLRENPGTPAATVAQNRLDEVHRADAQAALEAANATAAAAAAAAAAPPPKQSDEEIIFALASKQRYKEVVDAIDILQSKRGTIAWDLEMQRLYSLQSLGQTFRPRAIELGAKLAQERPKSVEVALLRADLLISENRLEESSDVLREVKQNNPATPAEREAQRRLDNLPAVANRDKTQWGELYSAGDYSDRIGAIVGSGFVRQGTYIPDARFLQPYVGMRYAVDTKSGQTGGTQTTIVADNFISFYGGVRAQLFPKQYLFVYAEGGINMDYLKRRNHGQWMWDYQFGIYGFKSWGPGVVFKDLPDMEKSMDESVRCPFRDPQWRGDWFADVGADFSYYGRYEKWLGYGQAHEGLRLVQFGKNVAVDGYVFQGTAWDVKGDYFDNLFEVGPGARIIWEPKRRWQIVLKTEWVQGIYFGRDDLHTRGSAAGSYNDWRVSLSVGGSW
ncbi:MAG: hypothetical protein RLZZ350_227 [Verrucomicrobiota bacterium]|jgi:tetratricopeptide (TPR) repeat protein